MFCDLPELRLGDVGLYVVKSQRSGLYRAGIAGTKGKADLLGRLRLHSRKPSSGNWTTLNRPWACLWRHVIPNATPLQLIIAEHLLISRLVEVGEFRHNSIFSADDDEAVRAAARSAVPCFDRIKVREITG